MCASFNFRNNIFEKIANDAITRVIKNINATIPEEGTLNKWKNVAVIIIKQSPYLPRLSNKLNKIAKLLPYISQSRT